MSDKQDIGFWVIVIGLWMYIAVTASGTADRILTALTLALFSVALGLKIANRKR